mmetsp:Transcript_10189/g.25186  ORF Transcript_10189/g.25186 Transcript_10189/m.25186 type:complete len:351 (-) Transcript_10189:12-1064(-)
MHLSRHLLAACVIQRAQRSHQPLDPDRASPKLGRVVKPAEHLEGQHSDRPLIAALRSRGPELHHQDLELMPLRKRAQRTPRHLWAPHDKLLGLANALHTLLHPAPLRSRRRRHHLRCPLPGKLGEVLIHALVVGCEAARARPQALRQVPHPVLLLLQSVKEGVAGGVALLEGAVERRVDLEHGLVGGSLLDHAAAQLEVLRSDNLRHLIDGGSVGHLHLLQHRAELVAHAVPEGLLARHKGKRSGEILDHQVRRNLELALLGLKSEILEDEFPRSDASDGDGALYNRRNDFLDCVAEGCNHMLPQLGELLKQRNLGIDDNVLPDVKLHRVPCAARARWHNARRGHSRSSA